MLSPLSRPRPARRPIFRVALLAAALTACAPSAPAAVTPTLAAAPLPVVGTDRPSPSPAAAAAASPGSAGGPAMASPSRAVPAASPIGGGSPAPTVVVPSSAPPVAASSPSASVPPATAPSPGAAPPVAAASPVAVSAPSPAAARPARSEPARAVRRGDRSRQWVALTFDAGADRGYAEMILNTLAEAGVPASFGMTGLWASQNRDLIRRMADEGHEFINHTWDHDSWTGLSTKRRPLTFEERRVEIVRVEEVLGEVVGVNPQPYFRSPYGDTNQGVLDDLGALGYRYNILWTVDSGGWTGIPAGEIVRRCLNGAVPGAIYVMHVGAQSQDGPALARVIAGLRAKGYEFARVSEIIEP